MKITPFIALFWIGTLLLSCSGAQSAGTQGGGATETSNGLSARIILADGTPAAFMQVHLIPAEQWFTAVNSSKQIPEILLTTDGKGALLLDSLPAGNWNMQVTSSNQGLVKFRINSGQNLGDIRLEAMKTLRLRALGASQVRAAGTLFKSDSTQTNGFLEMQVPQGNYTLLAQGPSSSWNMAGHVTASNSMDTQGIALRYSDSTLLIDDFADNDTVSDISAVLGCGDWYHNSSNNGLFQFSVANGMINMTFSDTSTARYAVTGLSFYQKGYRDVDFSSLREMCIRARGQGVLYLKAERMISMTQPGFAVIDHWALDTNWSTFCLVPNQVDSTQWQTMRGHVNNLTVALVQGSWMQLDSLMLHGLGMLHYVQ